jgi:hypothetical protein
MDLPLKLLFLIAYLAKPVPDWPKLLHLYSRLKPGQTVLEWMEAYDVHSLGIDARRFTSFGVIKVLFTFDGEDAQCRNPL